MVNAMSTSLRRPFPIRRFRAAAALAALLAAVGARPAAAQSTPVDPATGLRGFSAQSNAGTAAPTALVPSDGATLVGQMSPGETMAGRTKPRARKPNPTRPAKTTKTTLPSLEAYRTAPGRTPRAGSGDRTGAIAPAPTQAVVPYPRAVRRARAEEDPYSPLGIRVGDMTLRPAIEIDAGYADNPNAVTRDKKGSAFGRAGASLDAQSNWARHDFKATLRGGYTRYFSLPDADRPDGQASASLRLDLTRDTSLLFDAKGRIDSQRPGSPEITSLGTRGATLTGRPLIYSTGVGAGVTHTLGRASATLRGTIDRADYENATLSDGSTLKLSNQNYTTYGGSLRLGYEVTPGVKPFVEATVDRRVHDKAIDDSGYRRDSTGLTGRVGSSFEITRTLTGEASAGYGTRRYEDSRLKELRGPVFDAALIWSATPLTTFTFKGSTAMDETTIAGASGSINRKVSAQISHALLRNLTLGGLASYSERDYRGFDLTERTLSLGLSAEYALTRSILVRGSFTHDRLKSTAPNADYTANVFLLGLKLQR